MLGDEPFDIEFVGDILYNVFSEGQVVHPMMGEVAYITKTKINKSGTWIEFRGTFRDGRPIRFSIHPEKIQEHIKKV
ncbi:hypothetical protein NVP2275O_339 [Vibrio phage 2.275.O._10N.286.54.E11]|nr:hypothetical protein NVP2275O_339 [Vibrio phage 2.275.O._10N.286.54.E11]